MSRRGNIPNVFSGLAGWILLNYVTIKRLLLCVFLLQFQTKELLQSSQMLLVVEIMLQQQHVLHKGPQPHQTSIPKAQNMLQISA